MTAAMLGPRVVDRMTIPSGLVTRTMVVVVRPLAGHVSVSNARTDLAVVSVQRGDIFMRFTSAAQVSAVLAAFGAVREALRGRHRWTRRAATMTGRGCRRSR